MELLIGVLVVAAFLALASFASPDAAGAVAEATAGDAGDAGDGTPPAGPDADAVAAGKAGARTVTHKGRQLPSVLDTLTPQKSDDTQPPAKGGDKPGSDGKPAQALSPRLLKAAAVIGMDEAKVKAQVEALGADTVAAALAVHADALKLDANGEKAGEGGATPPGAGSDGASAEAAFAIPPEVRELYPDNGDLFDAIEGSFNQAMRAQFEPITARLIAAEEGFLSVTAELLLMGAGKAAKDITAKAVLEKAQQLAAGAAVTGHPIEPSDAMREALQFLMSPKAAEMARADAVRRARERGSQITGRPSGTVPPAPSGPEGKKNAALRAIHRQRADLGLTGPGGD